MSPTPCSHLHLLSCALRGGRITDHLTDTVIQQLIDIVPKVQATVYGECFIRESELVGKIWSIERCRGRCNETCRYGGWG